MSADNTILILKLKDQYRVGHFQATDNLYFKWGKESNDDYVSLRVFEFFNGLPIISTYTNAIMTANALYDDVGYVEYGIQFMNIQKTWEEVVREARKELFEEIYHILSSVETESWLPEKKTGIVDDLRLTLKEINQQIRLMS